MDPRPPAGCKKNENCQYLSLVTAIIHDKTFDVADYSGNELSRVIRVIL
jgi:hypothetical protein